MQWDLAQWFGIGSFIIGLVTFYQKDDRKLKWMMLALSGNHFIHFVLLGAPTAALSALLSGVRTGLSIKTQSARVAWLFIAFGIALGIWLAKSPLDMLPILGTSIGTFALFRLQGMQMRLAFLIGAGCWLVNNIIVQSVGGVLLEVSMILMNLLTIWRLQKEQAMEQKSLKAKA